MLTFTEIDNLEHSWTASVKLKNGQVISIWHTAWPMTKQYVAEVVSIGSDYPTYRIKKWQNDCK